VISGSLRKEDIGKCEKVAGPEFKKPLAGKIL